MRYQKYNNIGLRTRMSHQELGLLREYARIGDIATARTDLQSNVTILRGEIDSNLATARTDLQSNVTILRGEMTSNTVTLRGDLQSNELAGKVSEKLNESFGIVDLLDSSSRTFIGSLSDSL